MPDFAGMILRNHYTPPSWKPHDSRAYFGNHAHIEELQPILDRHKSFYNRAHTVTYGGRVALYSYNTKVAEFNEQTHEMTVFGTYSATTLRHIKEFLYQKGFGINSKSDVEKFIGVA